MKARNAYSQVVVGIAPLILIAACGDDGVGPTGAGGLGGAGGATSSSSGPATVGSVSSSSSGTSVSSSSSASSASSSTNGGGTTTSDGGGGTTNDGGGGVGGVPDGGGGVGGVSDGGGGIGGVSDGGGGAGGSSTASTAVSSTSSGIILPGGLDTCPGDAYTLAPGTTLQLEGTTSGAADDYVSCFGQTGGNEVVFAFTLEEAGSLRLTLVDSSGFNANIVIRATCDSATGELCLPASGFGDVKSVARHFAAGTYFVLIDPLSGAGGDFDLIVSFGEPVCGDAILNPGEVCDVGPAVANDGCGNPGAGNECQLTVPPPGTDQCPGESIGVPSGASSLRAEDGYSTLGYADDAQGSCVVGTGGVERVLALEPAITGTLSVAIGRTDDDASWICQADNASPECWDQFLYARTDCASTDLLDELDCADEFGLNRGEEISFDVIEGEVVYLFVDGFNSNARSRGPFNLHLDLQP
jgi:hypothetical protein